MKNGIYGKCPVCNGQTYATTCHNGIADIQIQPEHCLNCGWVQGGCPAETCLSDRCKSWEICKGKSIDGTTRLDMLEIDFNS